MSEVEAAVALTFRLMADSDFARSWMMETQRRRWLLRGGSIAIEMLRATDARKAAA